MDAQKKTGFFENMHGFMEIWKKEFQNFFFLSFCFEMQMCSIATTKS